MTVPAATNADASNRSFQYARLLSSKAMITVDPAISTDARTHSTSGDASAEKIEPALKREQAGVAILRGKGKQRALVVPAEGGDGDRGILAHQNLGAVAHPHHQDGAIAVAGGEQIL